MLGRRGVLPWGLAAFLLLHFALPHRFGAPPNGLEVLYTFAICLLLIGIVTGRPLWGKCLAARPLRYVGRRAYGIYLVQLGCITLAEIWFPAGAAAKATGTAVVATPLAAYGLACLFSVAAADLLYQVVERPGMLIGRRLSDQMRSGMPAQANPSTQPPPPTHPIPSKPWTEVNPQRPGRPPAP